MKVLIFDAHKFERPILTQVNEYFNFNIKFLDSRLNHETVALVEEASIVCSFVNDKLDAFVLQELKKKSVQLVALRSAGYNHVDLNEAKKLNIKIVRVPAYSPYAVAEHAVALIMTLNRKIHRAYARVKEHNFSLDGLVGFDLHQKTVGIVGVGKIGEVAARIMHGFGCRVLAYDKEINQTLLDQKLLEYVDLETLFRSSEIISLHVPLTPNTLHLINDETLSQTKPGVMIINTGRGGLIDTKALIKYLKSGHVGSAGLDVYEEEEAVFFQDLSDQVLQDDSLARLLTFPNVVITSHQGFLTKEALENIASTTFENIKEFINNKPLTNEL